MKTINRHKEAGYEIDSVSSKGYCIRSVSDLLTKNEIESRLKSKWVGSQIECYEVIDSTNTQAMRLAESGASHGTLVAAERQDGGKGRRGRSWENPAGIAVAMSILLRPSELEPANAPMLTLVSAMAVARAIEELAEINTQIKWPNDIVIDGKKVCGILTEMEMHTDYISHIVVGIGINVHNESFPEELADKATSIYLVSGKHISRAALVATVCQYFEYYYGIFMQTQELSGLMEEYSRYLVNCGQKVRVLDPKKEFEGIARGITARGELLVDTGDAVVKVESGEVSVRGIYGYV